MALRSAHDLDLVTVTNTAFDALRSYIESTSEVPEELDEARHDAAEFALDVPDETTGQLLSTLAATSCQNDSSGAVAITPAVSVVGLYLLHGLPPGTTLTCIDPEAEHQNKARSIFRSAGYTTSRVRFLPSRPLDVMGRLASGAYQLVYVDVSPMDLPTVIDAAWPLLGTGGTLVLPDVLLDGTLADLTRKDRDTVSAREADEKVRGLDNALVTRLPLGAGMTLVTRV